MTDYRSLITILFLTSSFLILTTCDSADPKVQITPVDTTSHNYTFQKWEFGEHSSSVLYDVAIIDENNIWAVGEIYLNDSTGEADPEAYNAVHWDGIKWGLYKIQFFTFCNQTNTNSYPAKSIIAFGANDIWISSGSQITHFNAVEQIKLECIPVSVKKTWGLSSNRIYAVGAIGKMAYYNGTQWEKLILPAGTENLDIYDIKGFEENGNYSIYAAAAKRTVNLEKKILKIEGTKVAEVPVTGIQYSISGIWGKPGSIYYAVGGGMYKKKEINSTEPWEGFHEGTTRYYIYSIDGQESNDIVCSGSYGELLHYNGSSWKSYQPETAISAGALLSVKMKDDMIVSVGYENPNAVIIIGKRK